MTPRWLLQTREHAARGWGRRLPCCMERGTEVVPGRPRRNSAHGRGRGRIEGLPCVAEEGELVRAGRWRTRPAEQHVPVSGGVEREPCRHPGLRAHVLALGPVLAVPLPGATERHDRTRRGDNTAEEQEGVSV